MTTTELKTTIEEGLLKLPYDDLRKKNLGEILLNITDLTQVQLEDALAEQKKDSSSLAQRLGDILIQKGYATEQQVLKALAIQLDLPFYDSLPINELDPSLVANIPIQFCRDNLILPIAKDEFNVTLAVSDPLNIFPMDDLRLILSSNINIVVCPSSLITVCINRVYEKAQDASQKVIDELNVPGDGSEDLEDAKDLLEATDDEKPIIRLVNSLLSRSVKEGASDIHIEPYDTDVLVRC